MTPLESLIKANQDYHEAVDKIFCDENLLPDDGELRAAVKAKLGKYADAIFIWMKDANAFITPHYEEEI